MNEASQKPKIKALEEMIHTNENHIPFFIITESHLKSRHFDNEIFIKDYSTLRADRPTIIKGGVVIYTHKDLIVDDTDTYKDIVCQAAMTYNSNLDLVVVGIYRPPRADVNSFKLCIKAIDNFIRKHEGADVQMMGDLNLPFLDWKTKEINHQNRLKIEVTCAEIFLTFMESHMMNQMVTEPTRKDLSILDLLCTNNVQAIHSIVVEKTELSDHDIVWTNLLYTKLSNISAIQNNQPDSPLDNLNLNRADWDAIREDLSPVVWEDLLQNKNVDDIYSTIKKTLIDVCVKHAPAHTSKNRNKLHIPPKRRQLFKIKRRINSKINICKYSNPPGYEEKLVKLNKRRSSIEIEIRDSIKEEKLKKEKDVIEKIKSNPRAFYSYTKKISKTITSIGPLIDVNKKLQSDPSIMSNILQQQYQKAFSKPDSGNKHQPQPDTSEIPKLENITITTEDILTAISEISLNSAPGPDKIPARLIRECKSQLAPALVILWQKSLDTGQIPEELLKQTIIPIYKKENKSLPANYRPISLTSHIIKILERIMRNKIIQHLESNNLLTKHQHGFRKHRSTLTQLLDHFDSILQILEKNQNADILYIDLSKAFDKVNHETLLHKLEHMKITGKINDWIRMFLTNRTQQVVVNGHKSKPAKVLSGVPQGTVLGPALFILYMNNITEYIKQTLIKMFADDSKLISSIANIEDRQKLINDLKALLKWTEDNSMQFNEEKFQLLQLGQNSSLKTPYSYNNINIDKSTNVRDLGIQISEDLSFKYHISEMVDNATNFASWLLRTFRTREKEVMLLLLKTYIIPRLEYCSAVWNPHKIKEIEQIEAVQRFFTARIENIDNLNYYQRLNHLKLFSLQRRRERFIIIHTWKIYNNLAPNDLNLQFHINPRLGIQAKRLRLPSKIASLKTIRFNFFSHNAPRLFNLIPGQIKDAKSVPSFKKQLDTLLMKIPDNPPIPGYKRANTNSLTEWVSSIQQAKSQMFRGGEYRTTVDTQGLLGEDMDAHSGSW